jgi:ribose-phosphate pyrophosphokinase
MRDAGAPACIAIHGIFAENAESQLREAGACAIVTTNTIPHRSNEIDVVPMIARELQEP